MSVYLDAIKLFNIQDVMRININEVSSCEIPRPPSEVSKEEKNQFPLLSLMYVVKKII